MCDQFLSRFQDGVLMEIELGGLKVQRDGFGGRCHLQAEEDTMDDKGARFEKRECNRDTFVSLK